MEDKLKLMEEAYALAKRYEAERGSCPQCVLAAVHETLGVSDPETIQAADSLAGGSALTTEGTCGALVGGLLAIGACAGRSYDEFCEQEKKRKVFKYSTMLYDRFVQEYGSPLCKGVQKALFGRFYNLRDKDEYQQFEQAGAHVDKCPGVTGNTARWTVEIIIDNNISRRA